MKPNFLFFVLLCYWGGAWAQFNSVPDPVFEQYLVDAGIDTDCMVYGQFLTAEIYEVVLVVSGEIVAAETLIKQ